VDETPFASGRRIIIGKHEDSTTQIRSNKEEEGREQALPSSSLLLLLIKRNKDAIVHVFMQAAIGETIMEITLKEAKRILTPQRGGFLTSRPYPFTHALSGYVGCGFGQTTCGLYCYAQFLPNWSFSGFTAAWGQAVQVKTNAAELLDKALRTMKPAMRQRLRIFMSSTTDPYQPLERTYQITRQCLEVFSQYRDLDLLVIQTRSPLAERDLSLLLQIPYVWLSISIETDDQAYLKGLRGGPLLARRWGLVRAAGSAGVPTQITVSPCLPYTTVEEFGQQLLHSGAQRLIVDTVTDGDGAGGGRTARSPFAQAEPEWAETSHAHRLYHYLCEKAGESGITPGWSTAGFCGIPPRNRLYEGTPGEGDREIYDGRTH
jgi:DNA repair photolyase